MAKETKEIKEAKEKQTKVKETKGFELSELFGIEQKGQKKTPFETFTIGKATFQTIKEIVEKERGGKPFENKILYIKYFVLGYLKSLGITKENLLLLKENWNK